MTPRRCSRWSFAAVIAAAGGAWLDAAEPDTYRPRNTKPPGQEPPAPADAVRALKLPDGFHATLFAGELQVRQPIAMTMDERGRVWVAEAYSYGEWERRGEDRIVILTDRDGDGVALRGLANPWGLDWDEFGEMFLSNNVSGHLFHGLPGAFYVRSFGADDAPESYERLGMIAAAPHYRAHDDGWQHDWEKRFATLDEAAQFGGGHSHCGLMIYQSDNWPAAYRGHTFMCNTQNRDYLLTNIIDPSAVVPKDFQLSVVTLADGQTLSGIIAAQDAARLTLQTVAERRVLERKQVARTETKPVSMMPEGLLNGLSDADVRSLLAFLMQLKP